MFQSLFHRPRAPCFIFDRRFALCFYSLGEINQTFSGIVATVEQHVFDALTQLRFDFFVNGELTGVDDSHVQSGADGVK